MKFRSKTGNVGPRTSWEKARPAFIDPTKVEFLALDPLASYSSFSFGVLVVLFPRPFALVVAWRIHDPPKTENNLLTETARNKNTMRKWYTDLGYSGGYMGKNYTSRRNHRRKPGWKRAPR
jgi:hypothetical protein